MSDSVFWWDASWKDYNTFWRKLYLRSISGDANKPRMTCQVRTSARQRFLVFSQCNQTWNLYRFIGLDRLVTVGCFFWAFSTTAVETPRSHYHIKLLNDEIKYNYDLLYTFSEVAIHLLKATSGGTSPDSQIFNVTSWWCQKLLQKSQKWLNNVYWGEESWLIFCPDIWNKMASNMQQTKLFQTEDKKLWSHSTNIKLKWNQWMFHG